MSKFNIGDKVRIKDGVNEDNTGIDIDVLIKIINHNENEVLYVEGNSMCVRNIYIDDTYWLDEDQLELISENESTNARELRIKYFDGATKMQKIAKGNWIDVYARKDIFVPFMQREMIPLGFALELKQGMEGHLAPRSSTFKTWGVIETNSVGCIDDTYIGDNDEWNMPVFCLNPIEFENKSKEEIIKEIQSTVEEELNTKKYSTQIDVFNKELIVAIPTVNKVKVIKKYPISSEDVVGTYIHKGDKIGQFRVMDTMGNLTFKEVESFGNKDRGGFGTTGTK